jgi:putative DNA primase/helicase
MNVIDSKIIYHDRIEPFSKIPPELKAVKNWVCFNIERNPDGGKAQKIPYQLNGYKASHSDPATWNSYDNCVRAVESGEFDAIGFSFMNSQYMGFDFDHCIDLENRMLSNPEAQEIIDRLCSYTEISASGTGFHILMKGSLPKKGGRKSSAILPDVEMYDNTRFFVMTGDHLEGTPTTIEERTTEIAPLYGRLFPPKPIKAPAAPTNPNNLTDADIITRATASNKQFPILWAGDWQGGTYPSHSEADLALCKILAWWSGNDPVRIDLMFQQSGLMRKKWKNAYYRNRTIEMAIAATPTTYSAPQPTTEGDECQQVKDAYQRITKSKQSCAPATKHKSRVDKVYDMLEKTRLSSMVITPIDYWDCPFIIKNSITAFTGEPACGKSTFVLARLHEVANKYPDAVVIYCDADNPAPIALERSERLRGSLPDKIRYWAGFMSDDEGNLMAPWDIGDPEWFQLIHKITLAGKEPIIVFDTLNSFMNGQNENDNAVVGKLMNHLRSMTNIGATCIIIHHTGKSDTSKESRGASAFKGGVDAGFVIQSRIVDCTIQSMLVKPFKSRLGRTETFAFTLDSGGRLVQSQGKPREDACLEFILQHQGKSARQIETLAARSTHGFTRQFLRDTIDKYLLANPAVLKKVNDKLYGYDTDVAILKAPTSGWLMDEDTI